MTDLVVVEELEGWQKLKQLVGSITVAARKRRNPLKVFGFSEPRQQWSGLAGETFEEQECAGGFETRVAGDPGHPKIR